MWLNLVYSGVMTTERNEISAHEVRVYQFFLNHPHEWASNTTVAEHATVAPRTARALTLKLVRLGILDQVEVFPAHRYRLAAKAAQRNRGYVQRLDQASKVFSSLVQ